MKYLVKFEKKGIVHSSMFFVDFCGFFGCLREQHLGPEKKAGQPAG
jgi:hypothetical protein